VRTFEISLSNSELLEHFKLSFRNYQSSSTCSWKL